MGAVGRRHRIIIDIDMEPCEHAETAAKEVSRISNRTFWSFSKQLHIAAGSSRSWPYFKLEGPERHNRNPQH